MDSAGVEDSSLESQNNENVDGNGSAAIEVETIEVRGMTFQEFLQTAVKKENGSDDKEDAKTAKTTELGEDTGSCVMEQASDTGSCNIQSTEKVVGTEIVETRGKYDCYVKLEDILQENSQPTQVVPLDTTDTKDSTKIEDNKSFDVENLSTDNKDLENNICSKDENHSAIIHDLEPELESITSANNLLVFESEKIDNLISNSNSNIEEVSSTNLSLETNSNLLIHESENLIDLTENNDNLCKTLVDKTDVTSEDLPLIKNLYDRDNLLYERMNFMSCDSHENTIENPDIENKTDTNINTSEKCQETETKLIESESVEVQNAIEGIVEPKFQTSEVTTSLDVKDVETNIKDESKFSIVNVTNILDTVDEIKNIDSKEETNLLDNTEVFNNNKLESKDVIQTLESDQLKNNTDNHSKEEKLNSDAFNVVSTNNNQNNSESKPQKSILDKNPIVKYLDLKTSDSTTAMKTTQSMDLSKSEPNQKDEKHQIANSSSDNSTLSLQSPNKSTLLPKKERDEVYFEGTKKAPIQQKIHGNKNQNKILLPVSEEENTMLLHKTVPETPPNVWNTNTSSAKQLFPHVTSVVIDRAKEEDDIDAAIVQSICTAQEESKMRNNLETSSKVKVQYDNDDDVPWGQVRRNLPDKLPLTTVEPIDKNLEKKSVDAFDRMGGSTERRSSMSRGAKKKEKECFTKVEKNYSEPTQVANQTPSISKNHSISKDSNIKPKDKLMDNKTVNPIDKDKPHMNQNRPIHGRSERNFHSEVPPVKESPLRGICPIQPMTTTQTKNEDWAISSQNISNKNFDAVNKNKQPFENCQEPKNRNQDRNIRQSNRFNRHQDNTRRTQDNFSRHQNNQRPLENVNKSQENINKNQNVSSSDNLNRNNKYGSMQAAQTNRNNTSSQNRDSCSKSQELFDKNQNYSDKNKETNSKSQDPLLKSQNDRNSNVSRENKNTVKKIEETWDKAEPQKGNSTVKTTESHWDKSVSQKGNFNQHIGTKPVLNLSNQQNLNLSGDEKVDVKKEQSSRSNNNFTRQDSAILMNLQPKFQPDSCSNLPAINVETKEISLNNPTNIGVENLCSGSKPNILMSFEGNQNVQRVLGSDPRALVSSRGVEQQSDQRTTSATSQISTVTTQTQIHSQMTPCANFSTSNPITNVNPSYYSTGFNSCQDSHQYEIHNLMDNRWLEIEHLNKKLLNDREVVFSAKRYLASAEANLFATQAKLDELNSRCADPPQMVHQNVPTKIDNQMINQNEMLTADLQHKYTTHLVYSNQPLPNYQRTSQLDNTGAQHLGTPPVQDFQNEPFIARSMQSQRVNLQPHAYLPSAYHALPNTSYQIHPFHTNASEVGAFPRAVITQSNEPRELRGVNAQFYKN